MPEWAIAENALLHSSLTLEKSSPEGVCCNDRGTLINSALILE